MEVALGMPAILECKRNHLPPTQPWCDCCSDPAHCPKNHVKYFWDNTGYKAELVLVHFKNDTIKGTQHVPLTPDMLIPLAYMERAHSFLAPQCPLIFHMQDNQSIYQKAYWSNICGNALSFGGHRVTAKLFRHLFTTSWRDFTNVPTTKLHDLTITQLDAAAADMMCTSTEAYNTAYDDSTRNRGIFTVLDQWGSFREFVYRAHLSKKAEK